MRSWRRNIDSNSARPEKDKRDDTKEYPERHEYGQGAFGEIKDGGRAVAVMSPRDEPPEQEYREECDCQSGDDPINPAEAHGRSPVDFRYIIKGRRGQNAISI